MGWKAVRDRYRIGHLVQVVPGKGICIGSPYVHDLIVIDDAGTVTENHKVGMSGELGRYRDEMAADPALLQALIAQEDVFERSIAVYTFEGANIIELACEELGWPNVTHDGRMMFENTFSSNRDKVVRWAFRSARAGIEAWGERVAERERDLSEARAHLARRQNDLIALLARESAHD